MIFRQLFDHTSYTYTYLLAESQTKNAALIDPVIEQVDHYLQLLSQLGLRLTMTIETHTHADHITASGVLREKTECKTWVSQQSKTQCDAQRFSDGTIILIGSLKLKAMYTPGHTDDSYCFYLNSEEHKQIFTGDTLLIRGCGRTDFQNGSASQQYHSLKKLMALPEDTWVYPGHDYRGWTISTIGEERLHNPRLQLLDEAAFVDVMNHLNLPNPKLMDVAVPANQLCGNQPPR